MAPHACRANGTWNDRQAPSFWGGTLFSTSWESPPSWESPQGAAGKSFLTCHSQWEQAGRKMERVMRFELTTITLAT
jgi:hypothetical protein